LPRAHRNRLLLITADQHRQVMCIGEIQKKKKKLRQGRGLVPVVKKLLTTAFSAFNFID
jgi:hypothetical protein